MIERFHQLRAGKSPGNHDRRRKAAELFRCKLTAYAELLAGLSSSNG
jgi:hypothetical protein